VPPFVGAKNFVANGGFDFWQRGTSFASPSNAYTADRFAATPAGAISYTVSQQPSFMTSSRYCLRMQRNSGQTSTSALFLGMAFETFDVIRMQGKTMTWSFYLKAGSNFSPSGSALGVQLQSGTGTDQGPFTLHTGEVTLVSQNAIITTTGTRFSYTFTVPTNATSMRWNIATTPVGTAGANDFYEIADMQLEIGSVATPFARAGGSIGGELALCQRYYSVGQSIGIVQPSADGGGNFRSFNQITFPITMRTAPTVGVTSLVAGTINKVTSNYYASLWGGSQADSTGTASGGAITNNNFMLNGINSTNKFYDGANWTASAEL
jgi:hypothetical protein